MIVYRETLQAFECTRCLKMSEVRRAELRDPEAFASHRELLARNHTDCEKPSQVETIQTLETPCRI